jgi:hypothetical protein
MPQRRNKTHKQKKSKGSRSRKQSKICSFCKKPLRQSGGDYRLATDITVDGIPMRHDAVIVRSDGTSLTAKEMKALEEE